MAKPIGIVACSAEGASLCYRTICEEAAAQMGELMHPEVSMHTYPLGEYMAAVRADDWQAVAGLMASSANKLASIGAAFVISPDNTIHAAYELAAKQSTVPWLHIAEEVALEAQARGFSRVGLLGTKVLMTGPVYPPVLERYGIACMVPDPRDREKIDAVIFDELVKGVFLPKSRRLLNRVTDKLKTLGCDAVVLACTEIPLLVRPEESPLPTLDSTRILARAALRKSLEEPAPGGAG
jgi:aspartate racemase